MWTESKEDDDGVCTVRDKREKIVCGEKEQLANMIQHYNYAAPRFTT